MNSQKNQSTSYHSHSFGNYAMIGFVFSTLCILLMAAVMMSYIFTSPTLKIMTFYSWVFLFISCIGQALCIILIPYCIYLLFGAIKLRRIGMGILIILNGFALMFLVLNRQVYAIYRFHINGFILNMLMGPGAGDIFVLNERMLVKEIGILSIFLVVTILLYLVQRRSSNMMNRRRVITIIVALCSCLVGSHLWHAYASYQRDAYITRSAITIPYFYPLTAKSLMKKLGFKKPAISFQNIDASSFSELNYPKHGLEIEPSDTLIDIYLVMLDSWNKRTFTKETMPNVWKYAQDNIRFTNHISSSNGTRCSVFGIYFGLPGYYWEAIEASQTPPLLITRLQQLGYNIQTFTAANINNPNFREMVFRTVTQLNESPEGKGDVLYSDRTITKMFKHYLDSMTTYRPEEPVFSWIFYDLPHAIALNKDENKPFAPAWEYADYTQLNNSLDPTEFWNLYRNCVYHDDILIAEVLKTIKERENSTGRLSLVIITGDHGQEFNENKHNYWGHSSNYSQSQIGVPMIVSFPETIQHSISSEKVINYRTTHYDIVPTIMKRYLGIKNTAEDFSLGYDLLDSISPRDHWHVAGSNINYAFITPGDTIIEKGGAGEIIIFSPSMEPMKSYNPDSKQLVDTYRHLNSFLK